MNRQALQAQQTTQPTTALTVGVSQRKCACGNHTMSGECAECSKKKQTSQRAPSHARADHLTKSPFPAGERVERDREVPSIVHEVLRSPGRPLDPDSLAFMQPRFGHDFSGVRVHTGAKAEESSKAVNALAYTVGRNVVFGAGEYAPHTSRGKQLMAHELMHVVQQRGAPSPSSADQLTLDAHDSAFEAEARRTSKDVFARGSGAAATSSIQARLSSSAQMISRADPDAVGYTMRLGRTARTGIQFSPTNVTDTRVGPVTVRGGLLSGGASRLNVIIGENLTLRALARQLLPLWTTATPFTPTGAVAPLPLDIITEDELAHGLLVYNQTYLPVPAMTNWRSGLRFPLPVEIDDATGVATLHPLQIRALAGAFDPAWAPFLDLRAPATVAPPAATVAADVAAFLARETTTFARGIHLGARALTNAVAELPFIRETFRQLGPASFDVALASMDNLVNREISLLAAQRDGAAILAEIRTALAAAPATPTAAQQASLARANLILGLVTGVAAQAPPGAARTRAEKTITVDTVKLDRSSHNPSTDVRMASAILSQCNVRVTPGVNATATNAQTIGWLGGNTDLRASRGCGTVTVEERSLFPGAAATFGFGARFRAFFPATLSGFSASGYSFPPFCATGPAAPFRNVAVVQNSGDTASLAHELGHILLNSGAHPAGGLMTPRPAQPAMRLPQLIDPQCTTIYNNA